MLLWVAVAAVIFELFVVIYVGATDFSVVAHKLIVLAALFCSVAVAVLCLLLWAINTERRTVN
jgi:hypothetical protein